MNLENLAILIGSILIVWFLLIIFDLIFKIRLRKENKRELKRLVFMLDKMIYKLSLQELYGKDIASNVRDKIQKIQFDVVFIDEKIESLDYSRFINDHLDRLFEDFSDIKCQLDGVVIYQEGISQIIRVN
jgi:hypothetical protein